MEARHRRMKKKIYWVCRCRRLTSSVLQDGFTGTLDSQGTVSIALLPSDRTPAASPHVTARQSRARSRRSDAQSRDSDFFRLLGEVI